MWREPFAQDITPSELNDLAISDFEQMARRSISNTRIVPYSPQTWYHHSAFLPVPESIRISILAFLRPDIRWIGV